MTDVNVTTDVNLVITAGLPYSRRIRIKDGKNVWTSLDDFEIRSQVRAGPTQRAKLKASLESFFTPSYDGNDIVLDFSMTGSATSSLSKGYYDVIISDKGAVDTRGIKVMGGILTVRPLVTSRTDV